MSYVSCETPRRQESGRRCVDRARSKRSRGERLLLAFMWRRVIGCGSEPYGSAWELHCCSWVDATLEDVHNDSQSSDAGWLYALCVRIKTTGRQG